MSKVKRATRLTDSGDSIEGRTKSDRAYGEPRLRGKPFEGASFSHVLVWPSPETAVILVAHANVGEFFYGGGSKRLTWRFGMFRLLPKSSRFS